MKFKKIKSLFDLYEINEDGTILRHVNGRVRKPFLNKRGYLQVVLNGDELSNHPNAMKHRCRNKFRTRVHCKIHRLVAEAWLGDIPSDMVVDHIDNSQVNNHHTNFRYVTMSQNWHNVSVETRKRLSEVSKKNVRIMHAKNEIRYGRAV